MLDNDSSSSPISRVPVDIFDSILREVGDDPRTQSACSLVAKRWYDVAIPFLFSTMVFRGGKSRPFGLLWGFLAEHPHVTRFVRDLRISSDHYQRYNAEDPAERSDIDDATIDFNEISAVLPKLPALVSLWLREVSLVLPPVAHPISPIPLQTLRCNRLIPDFSTDLINGDIPRMATVCLLLAACSPHTLVLHPERKTFSGTPVLDRDVRFIPLRSQRIHTVIFRAWESSYLHQWLEAILAPDVLRRLSTWWEFYYGDSVITTLRSLVLSAGRRLEWLEIKHLVAVDIKTPTAHPLVHLNAIGEVISLCNSLRRFGVNLHYTGLLDGEAAQSRISALLDSEDGIDIFKRLFSFAPPTLEYITINVSTPSMLSLAICDLDYLDRPWFRERCPALKRMHICLHGEHASPQVESAVVAALSGLHHAGLLCITLESSEWSWFS